MKDISIFKNKQGSFSEKENKRIIKVVCSLLLASALTVNTSSPFFKTFAEEIRDELNNNSPITLTGVNRWLDFRTINNANGTRKIKIRFDNGSEYYVYDQLSYANKYVQGRNIGKNGCSIFLTTTLLNYLTGRDDITPENIATAFGGASGYGGINSVLDSRKPIDISGERYWVMAERSEKLSPRDYLREEFVETISSVLKRGCPVIVNTAAIAVNNEECNEISKNTGITSRGGHMLLMMGLAADGTIYWADSVQSGDPTKAFLKNITIGDFYDYYVKMPTGTLRDENGRREVIEYFEIVYSAKLTNHYENVTASNNDNVSITIKDYDENPVTVTIYDEDNKVISSMNY